MSQPGPPKTSQKSAPMSSWSTQSDLVLVWSAGLELLRRGVALKTRPKLQVLRYCFEHNKRPRG